MTSSSGLRPLILCTGHDIADRVAQSLENCFDCKARLATSVKDEDIDQASFVIGYGILRGTAEVYKTAERLKKPWFVLDNGYFHPGHYDGYYRMGYRGTQGPYKKRAFDVVMPEPMKRNPVAGLVCPPSDAVCQFFGVDKKKWTDEAIRYVTARGKQVVIRDKSCNRALDVDLEHSAFVYTFNSGVGWKAISRGIPVVSDSELSIVGQWGKGLTATDADRREFVASLFADQFKLADVEAGLLRERVAQWL